MLVIIAADVQLRRGDRCGGVVGAAGRRIVMRCDGRHAKTTEQLRVLEKVEPRIAQEMVDFQVAPC